MSGGVLYANANVIMQGDALLLTRERIRKMAATDDRDELLKVLAECGYQTDLDSDEAILAAERQKTRATFNALCEDAALTTCLSALADATESNIVAAFTTIAAALPHIKGYSIQEYFVTLADMTNVRTFYKGGKTWVAGGRLTPSQLDIFPEMTPDQIEAAITQRLDALAAVDKDDIFTPNPLFWWYQQKQKEFIVVKTILMGKRLHYDATWLRENLRGLYEQFH